MRIEVRGVVSVFAATGLLAALPSAAAADATISDQPTSAGVTFTNPMGNESIYRVPDGENLNAGDLVTALDDPNAVQTVGVETTGKRVTLSVTDEIEWTSNTWLSLWGSDELSLEAPITSSGDAQLIVAAGSQVTQQSTAPFSVADLWAGDGNIDLNDAPNDFGFFFGDGTGATTVSSTTSVELEGFWDGSLALESGGAITDDDTAVIGGGGEISLATQGGDITLDGPRNELDKGLELNAPNGAAVTLATDNDLALSGSSIVTGPLNVNIGGELTQQGPGLTTAALASFEAGSIELDSTGNSFAVPPTLTTNGTGSVAGAGTLTLGAVSVGQALAVSAGNIAQAPGATIEAGGPASFTVGSNGSAVLYNTGNTFAGDLGFAGPANTDEVTVANDGSGELAELPDTVAGLTLAFSSALELPEVDTEQLALFVPAGVTQLGPLTNSDFALISGDTGAVELTESANDFSGPVRLVGTGDAAFSVVDSNYFVLDDSSLGGPVSIGIGAGGGSGATLSQRATSEATFTGPLAITAGGSGASVELTEPGNQFDSAISVAGDGVSEIALVNTSPTGSLGAIPPALDVLDLELGKQGGFSLPEVEIVDELTLTLSTPLTQTVALDLQPGSSAKISTGTNPITLTNPQNFLGGSVELDTSGAGGDVAIAGGGNLEFDGDSTVGGSLLARAGAVLSLASGSSATSGEAMSLISDAATGSSIGLGGVTLGDGAALASSGAPLGIWTGARDQNTIAATATLNGSAYAPGPEFVDTATEVWNTVFPAGTPDAPFTIFYKQVGTPPTPPTPPEPPAKPSPVTTIGEAPKKIVKTKPGKSKARVRIGFSSSIAGSSFVCTFEGKQVGCESPFTRKLKPGRYEFSVAATSPDGIVDPDPPVFEFRVKERPRKR